MTESPRASLEDNHVEKSGATRFKVENIEQITESDLVKGYKYIVMNSDYLGGRPALLGRRVSVDQILHWLAEGMTPDDIVELYQIELEVIFEVLAFSSVQMEKLRVAS